MALKAGIGRTGEFPILVATFAVQPYMFPVQGEFFVMVERRVIPRGSLVTGTALLPECPFVTIVLGMASYTVLRGIREGCGGMAVETGDLGMTAFEFERGPVVVKGGGSPRVHAVTFRAVHAEAAHVWFIFFVTGETVGGGVAQIHQRARTRVTGVAIGLHVRAHQCKRNFPMVEMFVIGVHAIVTGETVTAPRGHVIIGEGRVQPAVTIHAGGGIEIGHLLGVAIFTGKGNLRGSECVTFQRIVHQDVGKIRPRRFERKRCGGAAMFRMTVLATKFGTVVHHLTMRFCDLRHVRSDIRVTVNTAVGHRGGVPRRGVAKSTVAAYLLVGGNPADRRARLRVERARREHAVAAGVRRRHDDYQRDQGSDDGNGGKTAETIFLHSILR